MKKKFRAADLMNTVLFYDSYGQEEMLNKVIEIEFPDDVELKSLSIVDLAENTDLGFEIYHFIFKAQFTKDGEDIPFILHNDSSEFIDFYHVFGEGNGKETFNCYPDKGEGFPSDVAHVKEKYPIFEIKY